jgi:hypothetical protein
MERVNKLADPQHMHSNSVIVVVGDQITRGHLENCDCCAVEITMTPRPGRSSYASHYMAGHVRRLLLRVSILPPCPPTDQDRKEED